MKKATEALAAETEAAALEGILAPTTEQMRLLKRYKELTARAAKIKEEQEAIKATLVKFLDESNARSITVHGKNWVLISDTHKTVVDEVGMKNTFPELMEQYTAATLLFTSRVEMPRSRVTIKPV